MSVKISEISYEGYGRCLEMANAVCRLVVTLDKGPRIICFQIHGEPNLMFEDKADKTTHSSKAFDAYFYEGATWHIYGGHRLWMSPESMPETYYPDNDPVSYTVNGNTVTLTPPEQVTNRVQYVFEITLCEECGKATISHSIKNSGDASITFAPWALSVLAKGGVEIVPQPTKDTGLLGNRILALWPYSDMSDDRVFWGRRYITLQQNPDAKTPFKLGLNHEKQWSSYLLGKELYVKRYETKENGNYPDGGCSFETYTCPDFLEMESLGELVTLEPGKAVQHVEHWSLTRVEEGFDRREEGSIAAFAAKYIEK